MIIYKARSKSLEFPEDNGSSELQLHYSGVKTSLSTLPSYLRIEYVEERKKKDSLYGAEVNERRHK